MEMACCSTCGFLAMRDRSTRELCETDELTRQTADIRSDPIRQGFRAFDEQPICFALAAPLGSEMGEYSEEAFLEVITRQRDCKSFTRWQQGFSPKEHREMIDQQAFREWQASREDRWQEWQRCQAAEERKWRLYNLVAGAALALLGALSTLIAAVLF